MQEAIACNSSKENNAAPGRKGNSKTSWLLHFWENKAFLLKFCHVAWGRSERGSPACDTRDWYWPAEQGVPAPEHAVLGASGSKIKGVGEVRQTFKRAVPQPGSFSGQALRRKGAEKAASSPCQHIVQHKEGSLTSSLPLLSPADSSRHDSFQPWQWIAAFSGKMYLPTASLSCEATGKCFSRGCSSLMGWGR